MSAGTLCSSVARPSFRQQPCNSSIRLHTTSFTPSAFRNAVAARSAARSSQRSHFTVLAFRFDPHNPKDNEKIQDWRVKQMVELAHAYLIDYLTNKKAELADSIFAEDVVHKDVVWDPTHPTVGIDGMKHYLQDLSTAFPDFWVEVDQYATVDTSSVVVTYHGSATNLGEYHHHKATRHTSNFEGANTFKFNHDRSRITEIHVYRSAFAEDLNEMGERVIAEEGGFRDLRLQRLV